MKSWMPIALGELGVRELPGTPSNPRVIEYHQSTTLKALVDEVPWCSAFVNWVMQQAGIEGTKSAAARSWLTWGRTLLPGYGCVVVFSRGSNPTTGHVAFYVDQDDTNVWVLGGNQGDCVSLRAYKRSAVLGYRWPLEDL